MDKNQKIGCNVDTCMHNDVARCQCRLDKIRVSPCKMSNEKNPESQTACSMYDYCGDLNKREIMNNRQEES